MLRESRFSEFEKKDEQYTVQSPSHDHITLSCHGSLGSLRGITKQDENSAAQRQQQ